MEEPPKPLAVLSSEADEEEQDVLDADDVLEEYEPTDEGSEGNMVIDACGIEPSSLFEPFPRLGDDDDDVPVCAAELELHEGEPSYQLAVHPTDATLVASAGGNDKTSIFRVTIAAKDERLQVDLVAELAGHTDTVEKVAFSVDGMFLASGSLDGTVRIWKVHDWSLHCVLEGPSEVTWLEWHPRGAVIVAGSSDGTVWMWNAELARCMQVFAGNAITSTCGAFTPDGKILISGGDGVVFVWSPKDGAAAITYGGTGAGHFPTDHVISLAAHPVLPVAVVGFADGTVAALHLQHHQVLAMMRPSEQPVEHVGFMPKQPIFITAGLHGAVDIWDANNYRARSTISDPEIGGITTCTWLRTEGWVALGSLNGTVAVWDIRSNEKIHSYPLGIDEDSVYSIAEIPHSGLLLASFDDGKVRIYRLA